MLRTTTTTMAMTTSVASGLEITTLQHYIVKTKLIAVLATRNNLRVENARQPVRRKDILYV